MEEIRLDEIFRLESGAAYLVAQVAAETGKRDFHLPLLELEWEQGEGLWKRRAGEAVVQHHLSSEAYHLAEEAALQLTRFDPENPFYQKLYIEALYWQQRDSEVLSLVGEMVDKGAEDLDEHQRGELALFEVISLSRINSSDWIESFMQLFLRYEASEIHYRAFQYLEVNQGLRSGFDENQIKLINAMALLSSGSFVDAAAIFSELLLDHRVITTTILSAAYNAYRFGGVFAEGSQIFGSLIQQYNNELSDPQMQYILYESAALLSRRAGRRKEAIELFGHALLLAASEDQAERMRWYLLDTTVLQSVQDALELLPEIMELWSDPSYYSDTLEDIITLLVEQKRWNEIFTLYRSAIGNVDPYIESRLAYVCGLAVQSGYVTRDLALQGKAGPEDREELARIFFGRSMLDGSGRYYSLMGSTAMGLLPDTLSVVDVLSPEEFEASDADRLVDGYMRYGLIADAYREAVADIDALHDSSLLRLAELLGQKGNYYDSLRVMAHYRRRVTFSLTRRNLESLYPVAHQREIESSSAKNNIQSHILYALVREESYFNARIESHAGAVGLSQLMPATAEDMASRLKMESYDLKDPEDNLTIGSYYLAYLIERFDSFSEAIQAYNAGPGRMRRWKNTHGGLSPELMVEVIPFTETRNYVRRVLASAAAYGYLYYGIQPKDTAMLFFGRAVDENDDS